MATAKELMDDFARRTGLTGDGPVTRYLWTDAFAVCNFVGLTEQTGDAEYMQLAERLVEQVHETLGRHRDGDPRDGWISGLDEDEGREHPTAGGLRIGKPLPERPPAQQPDPRGEWDRDGQYFHYLTKWMHALQVMAEATGERRFGRWALELSVAAHRGFIRKQPDGSVGMVWKMSIDLSRPLVASMGHHDPLEGLVTTLECLSDAPDESCAEATPAVRDFERMCTGRRWATTDALGIGGLLDAAGRLAILNRRETLEYGHLLDQLLADAAVSLGAFADTFTPDAPAGRRLAFRELGLAIGLDAAEQLSSVDVQTPELSQILRYRPIAEAICEFWNDPQHRTVASWVDHEDINAVMLATALEPSAYLRV
ncbi:MAG: hypothetical protein ACLFVU_06990 [Phycisphaerae bacterium]